MVAARASRTTNSTCGPDALKEIEPEPRSAPRRNERRSQAGASRQSHGPTAPASSATTRWCLPAPEEAAGARGGATEIPSDDASWTAVRAVAWSSVSERRAAAAVEQAGELRAAAAGACGMDASELAPDLAGEEHRAQEARWAGRRMRRWRGRSPAVLLLEAHEGGRQLGRVVAVRVARVDDVLLDDDDRQLLEAPLVHLHWLSGVARRPARAAVAVEDDDVDEVLADVVEQHAQVVGRAEPCGLTRLGGHVADVHLETRRRGERVAHVADEQVRQDAAEQAARGR